MFELSNKRYERWEEKSNNLITLRSVVYFKPLKQMERPLFYIRQPRNSLLIVHFLAWHLLINYKLNCLYLPSNLISPYFTRVQEITIQLIPIYPNILQRINTQFTQKRCIVSKAIEQRNLNRCLNFPSPRRFEAEEEMYRLNTAPPTLYTVRGLFTRPVKNPPIGCNKLVYERFEPGRQLWYASTIPPFLYLQPLCPNSAPQSGSICSPVVDRRGNVVENALHRGKDDKSWFRGIDMPCRASRKRCWKREIDGSSRGIISNGGCNPGCRRYCRDPSTSGMSLPRGFISRLLTGFETRSRYRFAFLFTRSMKGRWCFLTNDRLMEIWRCGISLICFTSRIIVIRYLNQLYKLYQLWGKILYRKYDDRDESCLIRSIGRLQMLKKC